MIGKGKSIAHTLASIKYAWNQEKDAEVVFRQNIAGENPREVLREFRFVQDLNTRCNKKTLSFVLSPTIEDGKKLSSEDFERICRKFMKEMNLGDRQAIAFVHRNRKHTHLHLYVNRINFKGKAYKDSFMGKRSQLAAENVARNLGLKFPREVQQEKLEWLTDIRAEIKKHHDLVLRQHKPRNMDQYIEEMERRKIKVISCINKAEKLQGFRFEYKGHNLKGSEVHRSMSGGNIAAAIYNQPRKQRQISREKCISLAGKKTGLSTSFLIGMGKEVVQRSISQAIDYEY